MNLKSNFTPPEHNRYCPLFQPVRDTRIDTIKGLLIILVVFGHLLEQFLNNRVNIIAYNLIYSFHMPLFIIISGYFFNPGQKIEKLKYSTIKLAESFFWFFILYQCLRWFEYGHLSVNDLISPPYIMWYLWTLIFWRITGRLIYNKRECRKTSIILAFGLALLIGLLPLKNEFSIQRFFAFAFFFVIGIYMRNNQIKLNKYLLIASIPILFVGCYVLLKQTGRSFDDLRWILYYNRPYQTIYDVMLRFITLILGLSISLLMWNSIKGHRIMSKIGSATLSIYLLHLLPVKFYAYLAEIHNLPHDIISLLFITLGIVYSIYIISRNKHIECILNPLSHSLKLIKRSHVRIES